MPGTDRLSPTDTLFLHLENDSAAHMHVASVAILEGPAPSYAEFVEHIASRLHLVPRYRQKLAHVPAGLGRPRWVDDPDFDLTDHVRHATLPAPGDEERLRELAERLSSERLDRDRPLWDMWLIDGLSGGRFAVVSKTHHCLVDGLAAVDILYRLYDREPTPAQPSSLQEWTPRTPPSGTRLVADALVEQVGDLVGHTRGALDLLRRPSASLASAANLAAGVRMVVGSRLAPAPTTIYQRPLGPQRRLSWSRVPLDDLRQIGTALDATLNDVLLAAVSGALYRHQRRRGVTDPPRARVMVPVSVRTAAQRGTTGNQVAPVYPALPTDAADPQARLDAVRTTMRRVKAGRQAAGSRCLVELMGLAPAPVLALAGREVASSRLFNLTVSNVPGPPTALYLAGRLLLEVYPVLPLVQDHVVGLAVVSYAGTLHVAFVGDHAAMDDLDSLTADLHDALTELADLARAATPAPVLSRRSSA